MRCFRCQRFGHTQKRCTNTTVCAKCGESDHGDSPCAHADHCVNCDGDHASNSKVCPRYTEEKDIQELRVEQNLTFFEARKKYYNDKKKNNKLTYASVVNKLIQGTDASTQTPPLTAATVSGKVESSTQTFVDCATQTETDDSCGLTIRPYVRQPLPETASTSDSKPDRRSRRRTTRSEDKSRSRSRSRSGDRRTESESPQPISKQSGKPSGVKERKKNRSPVKPP